MFTLFAYIFSLLALISIISNLPFLLIFLLIGVGFLFVFLDIKNYYNRVFMGKLLSQFSIIVLFISFFGASYQYNQSIQNQKEDKNENIKEDLSIEPQPIETGKEKALSSSNIFTKKDIEGKTNCEVLEMGKTAICARGFDSVNEDNEIVYSEKLDKCLIKYIYRSLNEVSVGERRYSFMLQDVTEDCEEEKEKQALLDEFNKSR